MVWGSGASMFSHGWIGILALSSSLLRKPVHKRKTVCGTVSPPSLEAVCGTVSPPSLEAVCGTVSPPSLEAVCGTVSPPSLEAVCGTVSPPSLEVVCGTVSPPSLEAVLQLHQSAAVVGNDGRHTNKLPQLHACMVVKFMCAADGVLRLLLIMIKEGI